MQATTRQLGITDEQMRWISADLRSSTSKAMDDSTDLQLVGNIFSDSRYRSIQFRFDRLRQDGVDKSGENVKQDQKTGEKGSPQ